MTDSIEDDSFDQPSPAVLSWSGGKDAAVALATVAEMDDLVVRRLLTTVSEEFDRSTMHGVRADLYRQQADAIGLPIDLVPLPPSPSNDAYESVMATVMDRYHRAGIEAMIFADLHLEDIRAYRAERLADHPIEGRWPIWGRDSRDHVGEFFERGFRATVVAVNGSYLDASFAGRPFDERFLDALPEEVDPAGEHGEFHTFVWDGPIFDKPLDLERGEAVSRSVGETTMHYRDVTVAPRM